MYVYIQILTVYRLLQTHLRMGKSGKSILKKGFIFSPIMQFYFNRLLKSLKQKRALASRVLVSCIKFLWKQGLFECLLTCSFLKSEREFRSKIISKMLSILISYSLFSSSDGFGDSGILKTGWNSPFCFCFFLSCIYILLSQTGVERYSFFSTNSNQVK